MRLGEVEIVWTLLGSALSPMKVRSLRQPGNRASPPLLAIDAAQVRSMSCPGVSNRAW